MSEALKLWEEWFDGDGIPWIYSDYDRFCYFCADSHPNHEPGCIYLRAKKLIAKPRQYVVLGMHRSGTSLVANLLQEMGVFMGNEFLEPDESNVNGYWEDVDFLALNKYLLHDLEGDWKTQFSRKEILIADLYHSDRIEGLISKRNAEYKRWGWKDPRTSMLVWIYHEYLNDPHYVIVRRETDAIVQSLERVHGANENWKGLADHYWQHIRDFISSIPDVKYVQIRYEHLLDPGMRPIIVRELSSFIGKPNGDIDPYLELIKC